jgi:hypothetical protein
MVTTPGEAELVSRYQAGPTTLAAFKKSLFADDWRELMCLFMVCRTRSFIQNNYARSDATGRTYLPMGDGSRSYFPIRWPCTLRFDLSGATNQYAFLYSDAVVDVVNQLHLPRYGLAAYTRKDAEKHASPLPHRRAYQTLCRAAAQHALWPNL